ncbi:NAD(P)-dependent dehydrogenase, short-chain alcohol dehydrogenase family [Bosea sp. OK403]|uniref:3-ketoacyl-ACP reductase n=1 Tax=Bosea sp. OK403 TaxID=1855286 RepID=UPI0008EFF595|nr:3-ketoacyl-ACP reductase [Bosea sp. OK403]SFI15224.1 NAD(P)-dependent dehydrogenase, short-chain alcohol dehydrogenase family [Bosea sp. OK403]
MDRRQLGNALVTGAGRGIGRAIALALSDAGFNIIANDLAESDDLPATIAAIEARGGKAVALPGDISDLSSQQALVDEAWAAFGGLHCLVNNAGISVARRDDILKVTPESYDRLMEVNLRGPFFLTQAVARKMVQAPSEHFRSIVTISSINVEFASADRAEYCISKTGLAMMSQLFAARLAGDGINAYEIRPGIIRTDMTAVAKERYDALFADGLTPLARWGEPEDIGKAAAMLASGSLPYSTGEVVRVDGGLAVRRL